MTQWKTTFTVFGSMSFPDDMLRYDRCGPLTDADEQTIKSKTYPYASREAASAQVRIALVHIGDRWWTPTAGRWESFSWQVDQTSIKTEKVKK